MLGDDDEVFDSVTWESTAAQGYDVGGPSSGPGFRQSTAEGEPEHGPHDPKWDWYLITAVKDPVKELAETKDAYVSYLVTAKVSVVPNCCGLCSQCTLHPRPTCRYSPPQILHRDDVSPTSCSCETISPKTSQHVWCHHYQTSIGWASLCIEWT